MIVCQCHAISDRQVRREVRDGATSVGQVARRCGAGASCGGCVAALTQIIEQERDHAPASEADAALAGVAAGS